jgi:hypothetical protein
VLSRVRLKVSGQMIYALTLEPSGCVLSSAVNGVAVHDIGLSDSSAGAGADAGTGAGAEAGSAASLVELRDHRVDHVLVSTVFTVQTADGLDVYCTDPVRKAIRRLRVPLK